MFCPNCRRELPDDTKFCGGCGTRLVPPVQESVQEPVQYAEPIPFSQPEQQAEPVRYSQPVQFAEPAFEQPVYMENPAPAAEPKQPNKLKAVLGKIPAKAWKIGAIAAAALVVVVAVVCVLALTGGEKAVSIQPDGALYLKDGQLYYSDFSKKAPYEITRDLMEDEDDVLYYAYDIANTIHVTGDGSTMFYMDKLNGDDTGTLYWRSMTNFGKEAEKIAGGVSMYTVSDDGKVVTFLKNGTLYQYDMKDDTKLAKDVYTYRVSGDGKIVYYRNDENNWYVLKNGESEKVGSDITIEYFSDDFSTVYYMDDGKFYKKTVGKDKEKLVSGVEEILSFRDDGTFYYTKAEEIPLSDFFKEDTDEYEGLMDQLAEETLEFYELGYYNGKESVTLSENCTVGSKTGDVLSYRQYDLSSVAAIPLTKLVEYYYDSDHYYVVDAATEMAVGQLAETEETYVAIHGKTSVLDVTALYKMVLSKDEKSMYVLADVDSEQNTGTLYLVTLSNDAVKTVEAYDDDVYAGSGCYYASYYGSDRSDSFAYFKDVADLHGDLYVNGAMVDSDVYLDTTVRYNPDTKELVYYVDYNMDKECGTLKTWDGKAAAEIYDESYSYSILDNGDMMISYDREDDLVTLSVWNGKELTEIAEEVYFYSEQENGDILVATDRSKKDYSYTLNIWNGKELAEIAEDVYQYTMLPNGDILYLYDRSSKGECELYLFNGRKAEFVDEDVVALIRLPGTTIHYFD